MLVLDFTVSKEWNEDTDEASLETMCEMDIRYRAFLGDFILVVDSCNYSAPWGWIPLIDLAAALHDIVCELKTSERGEEVFVFTESDEQLKVARDNDKVFLYPSYVLGGASVRFEEMERAVREFCTKVFAAAEKTYPALIKNHDYSRIRNHVLDHSP